MKKKTVILGASTNPSRYAYLAAEMLQRAGHEIVPVGIKKGNIFGTEILDLRVTPVIKDVDTITLYIGPRHQKEWYNYIIGLKPKRVIFNPGTENEDLERMVEESGAESLQACTLVMLRTSQY